MQNLQDIDPAEFLAAGQEPLIKFEICVGDKWINLNDFPTDFVLNGDFEDWASPTDADNWTETLVGTTTINRESVEQHGGDHCVRFDVSDVPDVSKLDQIITLAINTEYTLSFWYKHSAGAPGNGGRIWFFGTDVFGDYGLELDGSWSTADAYDGMALDSSVTTWTEIEITFTTNAVDTEYTLRIRPSAYGAGDYSFYVDDISIPMPAIVQGGNYLESGGISLGGASMTPNPVEGTWDATVFNENGIFHPQRPNSALKDYFVTERLSRVSVGATYAGTDYYWQRIIGYMDVPNYSIPDYRVAISGGDYMKRLHDTELKFPDNYFGADTDPYPSKSSDGKSGAEMYTPVDAMNPADDGSDPFDNVDGWGDISCTFEPFAEGGTFVGRFISTSPGAYTRHPDVATLTADAKYICTFRAKRVVETGAGATYSKGVYVSQLVGGVLTFLNGEYPAYASIDSDTWKTYTLYFTAQVDGPLYMTLHTVFSGEEYRIDNISIHTYRSYWERYYELLDVVPDSKGPYHVTLDAVDVWQGEEDEGWWYAETGEDGPDPPYHPAEVVFFDANKTVPAGVDVVISYFTQQAPEDVVAALLVLAGVAGELETTATGITIDKVWFKEGTTCLEAIKMLCERCDYRFFFKYDGTPVFKPKPAVDAAVDFIFTDPRHIASINTYQDQGEIKNRIIIKGMKQAEPVSKEETMPSEFRGELSDADSIAAYGERTLTITNHLFQDQDSILNEAEDAGMCFDLLAEHKNPKWYTDLVIPFNPVPLELGDTIQWPERLSPGVNITKRGIIRDIKIDNFNTTYKCVLRA